MSILDKGGNRSSKSIFRNLCRCSCVEIHPCRSSFTRDKEELSAKKKENKVEVIKILETFLKQSNSEGLSAPTSDQEVNCLSWLGWNVVNGTAHDVNDLISSKLPPDPLMGMSESKQYGIRYQYSKLTTLSRSVLEKVQSRIQDKMVTLSLKIQRE